MQEAFWKQTGSIALNRCGARSIAFSVWGFVRASHKGFLLPPGEDNLGYPLRYCRRVTRPTTNEAPITKKPTMNQKLTSLNAPAIESASQVPIKAARDAKWRFFDEVPIKERSFVTIFHFPRWSDRYSPTCDCISCGARTISDLLGTSK
jgi:hypothetical protein